MTDDVTRPFAPPPTVPQPTLPQPTGTQPTGTRPPDLGDVRDGLGRLSRGLIIYGLVGLVVAMIGFGALVWVNGRISSLGERVNVTVEELATTMERTATVLQDASTTAQTFTVTIDRSTEALDTTADSIAGVRSRLEDLEGLFRAVNILGATPLGAAADAVGGIANAIKGLDTRLSAIADSLDASGGALTQNATSLGRLGDSTAALAARLRSGVIEDSVADVQMVITVTLLVFTAWAVVPAIGALMLGVWLRRMLARQRSG